MVGEHAQIERYMDVLVRGRGRGRGRNQSESTAQLEVRSTSRVYNLKTSEDCDDPEVITCTFQIADKSFLVLIDLGLNYSYVNSKLVKELNLPLEPICSNMIVTNPLENSARRVQLTSVEGLEVSLVSERIHLLANVILVMSAQKLMLEGCQVYIANVINRRVTRSIIKDILTVREFPDMFLDDFPRLPPDREVEFQIEVMSGSAPISIARYRMARES
ncbi:uncharacterized protein LOC120196563 [Hibiscus syriacus]|uniref:uncharacterized protein LOC120196563 n=1 Tax=Hibiscus syriacus TaxID=106335 RepID=UPI001922938F|nr:uncharacterized protein LOC120196563 [Hibiscus syriacus]